MKHVDKLNFDRHVASYSADNNQPSTPQEEFVMLAMQGDVGAMQEMLNKHGAKSLVDSVYSEFKTYAGDMNWTAMHAAAYKHQYDVIDLLLKSGANPNILDNKDRAPLHILVLHAADAYQSQLEPTEKAIHVSNIISMLGRNGADMNIAPQVEELGVVRRRLEKERTPMDFLKKFSMRASLWSSVGKGIHFLPTFEGDKPRAEIADGDYEVDRENSPTIIIHKALVAAGAVDEDKSYAYMPLFEEMLQEELSCFVKMVREGGSETSHVENLLEEKRETEAALRKIDRQIKGGEVPGR